MGKREDESHAASESAAEGGASSPVTEKASGETAPSPAADSRATSPEEPRVLNGARGPTPDQMQGDADHDRLVLFVVRALFFFVAATLGAIGARVLAEIVDSGATADPTSGILLACGLALVIIIVESRFTRGPIRTIAAITFGLLMGLVLSLVFHSVVEFVVEFWSDVTLRTNDEYPRLLSFIRLVTTTLFCYFGVTLLLQTKGDFKFIIPYVEFRKELKGRAPLLLDTSCFVDGRIRPILETGVLDYRLLLPSFVLQELQTLADSSNRSTRERGRRGMDILRELEARFDIEMLDVPLPPGDEVDGALLVVAAQSGGKILTTDFNLQKRASLQRIPVINVNDIATALKPNFVPGEALSVRLLRAGDGKRQAVGFLSDGTMVVVEEAKHLVGQDVSVNVTSSLQTQAGKMVFGKLSEGEND